MISVRKAFTVHTTLSGTLRTHEEGHWNEHNEWVDGVLSNPISIRVTATPIGDSDSGVYGETLQSLPEGERTANFMKLTSRTQMPINSIVRVYDTDFKVVKLGQYSDSGYNTCTGERMNDR